MFARLTFIGVQSESIEEVKKITTMKLLPL